MRGSPDIASRTNERMNVRTHERESIGPSANAEWPKTLKTVNFGNMEYDFLKEDHTKN